MNHSDAYAIPLALLALVAVPGAIALTIAGLVAKSPRIALVFFYLLGGAGALALALGGLGRAMVYSARDGRGMLAFGFAVSMLPLAAASILAGRAFTERRSWRGVAPGLLLALGLTIALGCVVGHQSQRAGDAAWVLVGLLLGVPVAALGWGLLARVARAEGRAAPAS